MQKQSTGKLDPQIREAKMSGPGRNTNKLIARLVVKYYHDDAKKSSWRCVAEGCSHLRQGNAQLERILKHSTTCKFLQESNHDLWQDAINESRRNGSLGAQLPVEGESDVENTGQSQKEADERPRKKLKGQATLDIDAFRAFGKKEKEDQRKVFRLQARADHAIMRLICARGLLPHIIDSPECIVVYNLESQLTVVTCSCLYSIWAELSQSVDRATGLLRTRRMEPITYRWVWKPMLKRDNSFFWPLS
ncbi:hypothetical protein F5888DRAFT_363608 [Russula emetica]|nr:hypothetical protein F5888DRAFT_363608 [Russula emetica]